MLAMDERDFDTSTIVSSSKSMSAVDGRLLSVLGLGSGEVLDLLIRNMFWILFEDLRAAISASTFL